MSTTPRSTAPSSPARMRISARLRRSTALLAAASLATTLSACTTAKEAQAQHEAEAHATAACPITENTSVTGTIRIGYQAIANGDLVVKDKGWLEACFPRATIKWSEFSSGGDVVQAMSSGSIDMGTSGSVGDIKGASAPIGLDVRLVWIHDVIGKAESLVVRDKSITNVSQLKGRKIAVAFGSTSQFSLIAALSHAGLATSDVSLVNLAPERMASPWQSKDIDAAWVWDPTLQTLIDNGGTIIQSAADTAVIGAATYDTEIALTSFVEKNPAFMRTWTQLEDRGAALIADDPADAATAVASELGNTQAAVLKQFKGYTYPRATEQGKASFQSGLVTSLNGTAKFLASQDLIDKALPSYKGIVYTTAIKEASK